MALSFSPLTFVEDTPDIIIERKDRNSYAVFPADRAELLKRLQTESNLEAVAQWYEESYGEPIDPADFLKTRNELQFIHAASAEESAGIPAPVVRSRLAWSWIGQAAFLP